MSWKKTITATVLTASIGASILSVASAAAPVNVMSSTYIVNGMDASVHTISLNGKTLASVRDLGEALGADISFDRRSVSVNLHGHTVKLKTNSDKIRVDDLEQQLPVAVQNVNKYNYIDLDTYLQGLGVSVTTDASGGVWIDYDLLGNADSVKWAGEGRLIASQDTDAGTVTYLVDVKSGQYAPLAKDASDVIVSADGKQAAYTDSTGGVYVIDLATRNAKQVTADASIKPEIIWSADGSAIYFLAGDKGSAIQKLDVATGTIAKILDDKVDYKANLNVSADGKTFTYTVATQPKVKDPGATEGVDLADDGLTIDASSESLNIYQYVVDPAIKDNKPAQLTNTKEDKLSVVAAADGSSVTYLSVGADDKTKSVVANVLKDKTVKTIFGDEDVIQAISAGSQWYLLTSGASGSKLIYELDAATGTSKKLYTVSDSVTELVAHGSSIAIVQDGKVFVQLNGKWRPVSR